MVSTTETIETIKIQKLDWLCPCTFITPRKNIDDRIVIPFKRVRLERFYLSPESAYDLSS